jgi:hypothetical protein
MGIPLSGISIRCGIGLLALATCIGQTVVENPKKPANPEAGRSVELIERMRIRDDGKEIVFREPPSQLQVGDDGSLYFANGFEHFKCDAQGRFVYRIVRSGQGPGEAQLPTKALLTGDGVLIQAFNPPKLMRFGPKGEYIGEDRTTATDLYEFVMLKDGKIYAFLEETPPWNDVPSPDYYEAPYSFCVLSPDLKEVRKTFQFPIRWYLRRGSGWKQARFDFAYKDLETIYVVHGIDYRIDVFNARTNRIERTITRKYDTVKRPPDPRERQPGYNGPPSLEYFYDINKVLVAGDRIWVITSTRNERQSRLVDVFDAKGKYVDAFYLEFPSGFAPSQLLLGRVALKNGFLYTVDEDAEGLFSIAQYEIRDKLKR